MKVHQGTGIPTLAQGQCYLTQAEVWTGVILTVEGKRRDARSGTPYILIFDDLAEAEEYAETRVSELPDVECHILDARGQMLKRVVKSGHKRSDIRKANSPWWKFWR